MTQKTYIEWDYILMRATQFSRIGECNRCGECCLSRIAFQTAYQNDEDAATLEARDGGDTTRENGIWNEVATGEDRRFFKFMAIRLDGTHCCNLIGRDNIMQQIDPALKTIIEPSGCSIYAERPKICSEWPFSPNDVANFPSCSYLFDEIQHWTIEPD